jgi:hypothetical protein
MTVNATNLTINIDVHKFIRCRYLGLTIQQLLLLISVNSIKQSCLRRKHHDRG